MRGEHLNEDPIGFLDEPPIQGGFLSARFKYQILSFYFHNTALDFLTHTRLFCKQQRGNMRRTALCLLVILGFSVSLVQADYQSGIKAFNSGDFEMAFKEFLAEAQKGNADAQNDVGAMYNLGQGVSQDHAKAVQWFRKAAEQGHAQAQNNLGKSYLKGQGVPQDYSKAIQWYEKAVEQGNAQAQYNLGLLYFNGEGVPQDFKKAIVLFRKAADQGITKPE
jgi:TPR repeat protein